MRRLPYIRLNEARARLGPLSAAVLLTVLLALAAQAPALAGEDGWKARLYSHPQGPELILAIDKGEQAFFVLQQKSPLDLMAQLPCTTGQEPGDKLREGDLRTPEGVYFVGRKLSGGLDFELYGEMAFTLNFPNPVDRIKRKTGHGIWIHGRGTRIVPRETKGCIALNTEDLRAVEKNLAPGIPVIIASDVEWTAEPDGSREAEKVAQAVQAWAGNWQKRSDEFFALYDSRRFALSEGSEFYAFKSHKQSIFDSQPWIQVLVDNVTLLPGPDYWVSTFDQFYRTPSLTSQVGKRLYWQKDDQGIWRIVGREYTKPSEDIRPVYLKRVRKEATTMLRDWSEAWLSADLGDYLSHYAQDATQSRRHGVEEISAQKSALWSEKKPRRIVVGKPEVDLHPMGVEVSFVQEYADTSGYSDKGLKTLVLAPDDGAWRILSEQWSALQ